MDIRKLQRAIVDGLENVKAQDIVVFNTEHLSPLFERVIIATGSSNRQTKALASGVREAVREAGFTTMRTEGADNGEWIIVDCAAAVVHIMQPAIRQYYQLEEIWGGKPVSVKMKSEKVGLVKASEPMDDAPVAKKAVRKSAGKPTAAPAEAAKPAAKKSAGKKVAAKKAPAKKAATQTAGTVAGRVALKKAAAKKASQAAAKPVAQKVAAKKAAVKKVAAKKSATTVTKLLVNEPKKSSGKAPTKSPTKAPARKAAAKPAPKPVVRKVAAKKMAVKKVAAKKVAAKRAR